MNQEKVRSPSSGGAKLHAEFFCCYGCYRELEPLLRIPALTASRADLAGPDSTELLVKTVERLQEEDRSLENSARDRPLADISQYLQQTSVAETRLARWLSMLCSQTYFMNKLTEKSLHRRVGLKLVTTSLQCCGSIPEPLQTPVQAIEQADCMAISASIAAQQQEDAVSFGEDSPAAMEAIMRLDAQDKDRQPERFQPKDQSPREIVGASLSAAFQAAADAAANVAGPMVSNWSHLTSAAASSLPVQVMTTQLQGAAAAGHSSALASMAMVTAALESAWSKDRDADLDRAARAKATSPTQWFVADDASKHTRYFVIQGSETIDHWKVNVTFDPVTFEDPAWGVSVHRGIYAAAQALYDRFLPMGPSASAGSGLLSKLGLGLGAVRNVVMHRDIVPRAFACDYTLVADLLARVSSSFRNHTCLHAQHRKVMYYYLGRVMVLQPDASLRFVHSEEAQHPLLPQGCGLYTLRAPGTAAAGVSKLARTLSWEATQRLADTVSLASEKLEAAVSNIQPAAGLFGRAKQKALPAIPKSPPVASLTDAVMELLNSPHPLEILGNVKSYGHDGAISRFHNPDNYSRALAGVLRAHKAAAASRRSFKESASNAVRLGWELFNQEDDFSFPPPSLNWHGELQSMGDKLTPGPNVFTGLGLLSSATLTATLWQ
ncbi:hypothetical protein WJX73_000354 [Symbiochloris irregularis]|uniref:Uncharacterized protein n=1 Tax=Symbiochloris irregularis TaxID=706552 RepID=A0AAW1Q3T4_9CHLO